MDTYNPQGQTLENTNRALLDLERKLSFSSSTSSNHTHQSQHSQHSQQSEQSQHSSNSQESHNSEQSQESSTSLQSQSSSASSVIINRELNGFARNNVQSSVLSYIKNSNTTFNAGELFLERQQKFYTKFGKHYNDDSMELNNPMIKRSLHMYSKDLDSDESTDADENGVNLEEKVQVDSEDECSEHVTVDENANSEGEEEEETFVEEEIPEGDIYEEESDEEILLPPSPPRSPPRDLDPDKLYGLYEFSGPDPSHCTLMRDEPVFLVNDEDNYWWLIRKMTKEERNLHRRKCQIDEQNNDYEDDVLTDEEDGKLGFVPAECLETYGERLARLNCFKNEELEKTSRDGLFSDGVKNSFNGEELQSAGMDSQVSFKDENSQVIENDSLLYNESKTKSSSNKSVTFENLGELDIDENDDDLEIIINDSNFFGNTFYDFAPPSLGDTIGNDEERTSEVLSDVYPSETPLVINKNNRKNDMQKLSPPKSPAKKSHSAGETEATFEEPVLEDQSLHKPTNLSVSTSDTISIGSYSPDTPTISNGSDRSSFDTPIAVISDDENDCENGDDSEEDRESSKLSQLRRSIILDRLNQVTSDIQRFQINDYESADDEDDESFHHNNSNNSVSSHQQIFSRPNLNASEESVDETCDKSHNTGSESDVTPLTSMNSFYNPVSSSSTDLSEKRKSKPVHEMFMPILGKFDQLAEKLAQLDDLV